MKYTRYKKYKPSWIDWIWEIPQDWEVLKIKNVWYLSTSSVDKKSLPNERPINLLNYMDIYNSKDKKIDGSVNFMKVTIKPSQYTPCNLKEGDIIFTPSSETSDDIWHSAVVTEDLEWVVYSYHTIRLRFNNYYLIDNDYKRYVFNNHYFLNQLSSKASWTTRMTLWLYDFKDSNFLLPPLHTQQKISSFLDKKTSQIDKLIEKDKKLIGFLKEKRVSLINTVVIKWLDKNVEMKDSGVDWIWKIPRSWWNTRLKFLSVIFSWWTPDKTKLKEYWENWTIPWIASWEVNQEYIKYPTSYITKEWFNNSSAKMIKRGAILMALAWQWKTKGSVWYLEFKSTCNQSLWAIEVLEKYNSKFIFYWLKNNYKNIRGLVWDWERDWLNLDHLSNIPVPLPSSEEQKQIVDFLDKETQKIDIHIQKVEKRISLYEEYKKSLVHNAVTGNIEII